MTILIYTKDGCPFCVKATDFLKKTRNHYMYIDLTDDAERQEFYNKTGTNSMPQIYQNGELIGGYDDLMKIRHQFEGPRITTKKSAPTYDYEWAIEAARAQRDIFWTPDEIPVESDVQDILVNCTDSERHGILTVLRLFSLYEMEASNFWLDRIRQAFPRPDIQMMASLFGAMEQSVHLPFYNKINEVLNVNTDDFYLSYVDEPVLKERMEFIDEILEGDDLLLSVGIWTLIEGAILYSSFAFLKSFQANGKNLITNIVSGVNFSVRDESLHMEGSAIIYKTLLSELENSGQLGDHDERVKKLRAAAMKAREHEHKIVDMIFEKGNIVGITSKQLKNFVDSRIDEVLVLLGLEKEFNVTYNPIAKTFYQNIGTNTLHDFFSVSGSEYVRDWNEAGFSW